jgi:hypothetical protein
MHLRGHHLICLHHFRGEGYSEQFVSALARLIARAEGGEPVRVVAGPDELCRSCPWLAAEACSRTEDADAEIREMDETALRLLGLAVGDVVPWSELRGRLAELMPVWRAKYCAACEWRKACQESVLRAR